MNDGCYDVAEMVHRPWFVLPPLEEHYYLSVTPDYEQAPPWRSDCLPESNTVVRNSMQFIYPKSFTEIYIPVDLNGQKSKVVFKVAHRKQDAVIYWHLDEEYIGKTEGFHEMALAPGSGEHVLTLVDGDGGRLVEGFFVVSD